MAPLRVPRPGRAAPCVVYGSIYSVSDQEDPPSVIERGTAFVPGSSVVIVAGLDDDDDNDDLDDLRNVFVTTRPWNVFRESALITRGEAGPRCGQCRPKQSSTKSKARKGNHPCTSKKRENLLGNPLQAAKVP